MAAEQPPLAAEIVNGTLRILGMVATTNRRYVWTGHHRRRNRDISGYLQGQRTDEELFSFTSIERQ
jgi:hypothetical protein